jgi:membrane fusion protein, multidrug efflux system
MKTQMKGSETRIPSSRLEGRERPAKECRAGGRPRPARGSALLTATITAVILCGAVCGCYRAVSATPPKPPAPVAVKAVRPKRGELTRSITLPAVVHAYQQATLYAKVAGYLRSIQVEPGDHVQAGALLADIEVPELLADRAKSKAEVAMTEAEFLRLERAHDQAADLVVQQVVDKARGNFEMAKANLEQVETLLHYARITAPFSGVITRRFVDPGAFIPAAASGSTSQNAALVTLADFSRVRIQVSVPEPEVPHITNGLPVNVSLAELPDRVFHGSVTRYAHALDELTRTMAVEIDLPNPQGELRPGMYAKVEVILEHKSDALRVPTAAVLTENSKDSVLTVVGGKTRKVAVTLGFKDGQMSEVLTGLNPGDAVVLAGNQPLSEGLAVAIEEVQ